VRNVKLNLRRPITRKERTMNISEKACGSSNVENKWRLIHMAYGPAPAGGGW